MIANINGRNFAVTDSIRSYAEKKAAKLDRFFSDNTEVQIRLSQERGARNIAEVTVALPGAMLRVEEVTADMYASIDAAIDKIIRQIRRHRTKLEKRLREGVYEAEFTELPADEPEEAEAKLVRVKRFSVKPISVDDAIAELEMLGHSFYLFQNIETNGLCVVYKRQDGNYGLLEPEKA